MRRKNKKKSMLLVLLLLVASVSMGYAILNTTLNIDGTSKIKDAKWNIYWENPSVSNGSIVSTLPTIDSLKTTASFDVTLNNPGDYYEFLIDAKNAGTIDAMISEIHYKLNGSEIGTNNQLPAYINYTVTKSDDTALEINQRLNAGGKETYKVRVEFKKDIQNNQLPQNEVELQLDFSVIYVQANDVNSNPLVNSVSITMPEGKTKDTLEVGDEICINGISTECFNFIRYDGDDIVMLAKWNLKVGEAFDSAWRKIDEYTSEVEGYGLQDSMMKGFRFNSPDYNYGVVAFSTKNYWYDEENYQLKSKYGSSFPADIYDPEYNSASGDNYSVAYYVEQYKRTLVDYGAPIKDARLLTYSEITNNVGCTNYSNCSSKGFIVNTSFWLGSANADTHMWVMNMYDFFLSYYYTAQFGVRPVIVISKADI